MMKEQSLRINLVSTTGSNESIQVEPSEVPNLARYSLGDTIEGGALTESLSGRTFRITGAQNNTGAPYVPFLDSPRYILASSRRMGNRRNIRGQRIRRLFFPRRLTSKVTNLNLVEL